MCAHLIQNQSNIMWRGMMLFTLVLFTCIDLRQAAKSTRYSLTFETIDCKINQLHILSGNCTIVQPKRSTLNAEFMIAHDLNDLKVLYDLQVPRPPSRKYIKLIEIDVDICKLFRGEIKNHFVDVLYESIFNDTNIPKRCPLPKGFVYYHDINLLERLPAFLPEASFSTKLNVYTTNHGSCLNLTLRGHLTEIKRGPKIFF